MEAIRLSAAVLLLLAAAALPAPGSADDTADGAVLNEWKKVFGESAVTSDGKGPLASWNTTTPCADGWWTGVTCTEGRVTRIALERLGLAATIGPDWNLPDSLEYLSLANNKINGQVRRAKRTASS